MCFIQNQLNKKIIARPEILIFHFWGLFKIGSQVPVKQYPAPPDLRYCSYNLSHRVESSTLRLS